MFPEITHKLLNHDVNANPALLKGYTRVALKKRGSKAKGPAIYPDSNKEVNGILLTGLSVRDLDIIKHFEEEAKGYELCAVELDDGRKIQTKTYQLISSFREKVSGDWVKEDFTKSRLNYYLNERIPNLLSKWGYSNIDKNEYEDKQILYLKRNWELLEVFKNYRMRIPSLIAGAMVVFTSFVLQSKEIAREVPELIGVTSLILLMGILGCVLIYWVWRLYKYTNEKIDYLYTQLEMKNENFSPQDEGHKRLYSKLELAPKMFYAGFVMVIITCLICALGIIRSFTWV